MDFLIDYLRTKSSEEIFATILIGFTVLVIVMPLLYGFVMGLLGRNGQQTLGQVVDETIQVEARRAEQRGYDLGRTDGYNAGFTDGDASQTR